jgi:hypothetical protein
MLVPLWNLLEPSGTIPINSETILKSKNCFPLYESYSLDHSGTSRDVLDLIRDSEQKLHKPIIHSILASMHVKCVTLRVREYADMIFYQ